MVLTIFEAGERDYIALLPMEGAEAEEGEVYLYRYSEDAEGNPNLDNIEDDDEYEIVADAFDELLDDQEFDELVSEVTGLFAGGQLSDEAIESAMKALNDAYWIAKEKNKKYTPKKHRKDEDFQK